MTEGHSAAKRLRDALRLDEQPASRPNGVVSPYRGQPSPYAAARTTTQYTGQTKPM